MVSKSSRFQLNSVNLCLAADLIAGPAKQSLFVVDRSGFIRKKNAGTGRPLKQKNREYTENRYAEGVGMEEKKQHPRLDRVWKVTGRVK